MLALIAFPVVAIALKTLGLSRVQAALMRLSVPPPIPSRETSSVVRMVEVAARRGVWHANCLQRSLLLWWLLRRRGIASEIRIGARKPDLASIPAFHAWVEVDGHVINDRQDIAEEYASFNDAIEPSHVRFE